MLLITFACVLSAQAPATSANPFLGSWKLNPDRSKLPTPPPSGSSLVRIYAEQGDGFMIHTVISTYRDGASFTFAAVKYDGNEYPVYFPESLAAFVSTGKKTTDVLIFTRVNAFTLQYSHKENGREMFSGTFTISQDGKTMTDRSKFFDNQGKETSSVVEVFDKL